MKKRIMTAAVAIPVLLLLLLVADKVITAVAWGMLLSVSAYELLYTTGLVRNPKLVVYRSSIFLRKHKATRKATLTAVK